MRNTQSWPFGPRGIAICAIEANEVATALSEPPQIAEELLACRGNGNAEAKLRRGITGNDKWHVIPCQPRHKQWCERGD